MPEIRVGQKWRDKDKRREKRGDVRTFTVISTVADCGNGIVDHERVTCWDGSREHNFRRSRFGSGRANDSFELVEDANA